jgi:hypothetical protein
MTMTQRTGAVSGAIAAIAMLAAQVDPATALTLYSPAGVEKAVSPQVEKVWCRWGCGGRGWGWRGGGWGWGAGAAVGALAAGAIVGAAAAPYYGYGYGYPNGCLRRAIGPYGGAYWVRVC